MEDRVHPQSSKPTNAGGPRPMPPTKAQQYGAARPAYRPGPLKPPPRRRRSCCCSCFLWTLAVVLTVVVLAAVAGAIFYSIYRPHRPSFSVAGLRVDALNVTAAGRLTSRVELNVTVSNPNKKLAYLYDDVAVSVVSGGVAVGEGSFPGFRQGGGESRVLSATVVNGGEDLDGATAGDLRKKSSLGLEIDLETKAGVKVGGLTTKKVGIRVRCTGVSAAVPKGKGPGAPANLAGGGTCEVKLRVKIWKWYI